MAKLLLVEDDNNLREIYEARLSAEGYDITTAQNGEEALSVAKSVHPDLIISDVMMPRISGFEMLDILRNTDALKNVKVIMLTALGQAEDRNRGDNLGADKYLVKSQVTLEDIVNAAAELLNGPATPVSPAPGPDPNTTATATPAAPAPMAPDTALVSTQDATDQMLTASSPLDNTVQPFSSAATTAIITPVSDGAVVSVPDPDPISPAQTQDNDISATPESSGIERPTTVVESNAQDLAAEEAAIEQQIAAFAKNQPGPATPIQSSIANNDTVLAQAMTQLTDNAAPQTTTPEAVTIQTPTPQSVGGQKVIQPLSEPSQTGPDLQALLAAEDAKEAASAQQLIPREPVAAEPATLPSETLDTTAPQPTESQTPAIDPNTIAL